MYVNICRKITNGSWTEQTAYELNCGANKKIQTLVNNRSGLSCTPTSNANIDVNVFGNVKRSKANYWNKKTIIKILLNNRQNYNHRINRRNMNCVYSIKSMRIEYRKNEKFLCLMHTTLCSQIMKVRSPNLYVWYIILIWFLTLGLRSLSFPIRLLSFFLSLRNIEMKNHTCYAYAYYK